MGAGLKVPTFEQTLDLLGLPRADRVGMTGRVAWLLYDEAGDLIDAGSRPNLITQTGDQYLMERATGISGPPGQVTGMKLGTGTTAPSKTGSGAALGSYQSGSDKAIDGTYPQSSLSGSSRQILWQVTWGAGVVTANGLAEVVIVNDMLADSTSTAANTLSRALLSPVVNKGASDSLVIQWAWLGLGA